MQPLPRHGERAFVGGNGYSHTRRGFIPGNRTYLRSAGPNAAARRPCDSGSHASAHSRHADRSRRSDDSHSGRAPGRSHGR